MVKKILLNSRYMARSYRTILVQANYISENFDIPLSSQKCHYFDKAQIQHETLLGGSIDKYVAQDA